MSSVVKNRGLMSPALMPREFEKLSAIADEVSQKHGLIRDAFFGRNLKKSFVWPQQEFHYRAYRETRLGMVLIGKFSGRNHKTVWEAVNSHEKRMKETA